MVVAPPRQLSKTFQPTSGTLLAPPHAATERQSRFHRERPERLTQNERTCCLGNFGLLCQRPAPSTDWLFRAEAACYWGKTPSPPPLPSCWALCSSPCEGKLWGTGQRQWNADVECKSWGIFRKMQHSEIYSDREPLLSVETLNYKCVCVYTVSVFNIRSVFAQSCFIKSNLVYSLTKAQVLPWDPKILLFAVISNKSAPSAHEKLIISFIL